MERSLSGSCGSVWSVDQVYSLLVCRLTGELTLVGLELQDASMTTWLKEFRSKPFLHSSLLSWPPGTTENLQTSEPKADISQFLPLIAEPHSRLPAPGQTRCGHASQRSREDRSFQVPEQEGRTERESPVVLSLHTITLSS